MPCAPTVNNETDTTPSIAQVSATSRSITTSPRRDQGEAAGSYRRGQALRACEGWCRHGRGVDSLARRRRECTTKA
eukprot:2564602-Pleurochrysis_carterae.AAC.1